MRRMPRSARRGGTISCEDVLFTVTSVMPSKSKKLSTLSRKPCRAPSSPAHSWGPATRRLRLPRPRGRPRAANSRRCPRTMTRPNAARETSMTSALWRASRTAPSPPTSCARRPRPRLPSGKGPPRTAPGRLPRPKATRATPSRSTPPGTAHRVVTLGLRMGRRAPSRAQRRTCSWARLWSTRAWTTAPLQTGRARGSRPAASRQNAPTPRVPTSRPAHQTRSGQSARPRAQGATSCFSARGAPSPARSTPRARRRHGSAAASRPQAARPRPPASQTIRYQHRVVSAFSSLVLSLHGKSRKASS